MLGIELNCYSLHNVFIIYAKKMAEKMSAVQSLVSGSAHIAVSSLVEEEWVEPACPKSLKKCQSATNSPVGSPPAHHKFNTLPKSSSLDVLTPEDKSPKGTPKSHPSKPQRSHSYQPTRKFGYEDHKHKEV